MSEEEKRLVENVSYGPMGIIALESSKTIGSMVNDWIVSWRNNRDSKYANTPDHDRYQSDDPDIIKYKIVGSIIIQSINVTICHALDLVRPDEVYASVDEL